MLLLAEELLPFECCWEKKSQYFLNGLIHRYMDHTVADLTPRSGQATQAGLDGFKKNKRCGKREEREKEGKSRGGEGKIESMKWVRAEEGSRMSWEKEKNTVKTHCMKLSNN